MIVNTETRRLDRICRMETWHRCFAWLPVTTISGDTVWLGFVERRLKDGKAYFDFDGLIRNWEYRR